jgi:hypothetical protein
VAGASCGAASGAASGAGEGASTAGVFSGAGEGFCLSHAAIKKATDTTSATDKKTFLITLPPRYFVFGKIILSINLIFVNNQMPWLQNTPKRRLHSSGRTWLLHLVHLKSARKEKQKRGNA